MAANDVHLFDMKRSDVLLFGFVEGYRARGMPVDDAFCEFRDRFCIDKDATIAALKHKYYRIARRANINIRRRFEDVDETSELIKELKRVLDSRANL